MSAFALLIVALLYSFASIYRCSTDVTMHGPAAAAASSVMTLWPFSDSTIQLDRDILHSVATETEFGCDEMPRVSLKDEKMLAHGSAKGVWLATHNGDAVIVKRPIRHTRFANKGFNESYMVDVMVREANLLRNLRRLPGVATRLLGSCIDHFNHTVNVVEFLDSLQGTIQGAELSWRQRVDVGVRLAQLLAALDHFEPHPLLLCDFTARQFGITPVDLQPRLVDVDSLTPYRGRYQHPADRACNRTHPQCASKVHSHCFGLLTEYPEMTEFQCTFADDNVHEGYCHGFDRRTHVFALGKLLLEELLIVNLKDAPNEAFVSAARNVVDLCTRPSAGRRLSLLQVTERLKALVNIGDETTARDVNSVAVRRPRASLIH
jgi:hypothetical protein